MSNTPENKPIGPFTMTPARIILLAFGVLALAYIIGAMLGGVENYDLLKQARNEALSAAASSEAPPAP